MGSALWVAKNGLLEPFQENQMKKLSVFMCVLAMAFSISASGESLLGDVDGDNQVNIADVTILIDYLLSGDASTIDLQAADCNGDSQVNIADITDLIDYLLIGSWPQNPEPTEDYVDLGLPSGTLWATHNVGATNPEDYGDYFAWGETETKEIFTGNTYKWVNVVNGKMYYTKYNTKSDIGTVDDKTELDLEDDAAYVNWGSEWRMPSREQVDELIDNCTWEWTEFNGVIGELFTGPNGKTIFLPAAGDSKYYGVGSYGCYWSRSIWFVAPNHYFPQNANDIYFTSEYAFSNCISRTAGCTVRPVRAPQE